MCIFTWWEIAGTSQLVQLDILVEAMGRSNFFSSGWDLKGIVNDSAITIRGNWPICVLSIRDTMPICVLLLNAPFASSSHEVLGTTGRPVMDWRVYVLGLDGDLPEVLTIAADPAVSSTSLLKGAVAPEKTTKRQDKPTTTGRVLTDGPAVFGGTFIVSELSRLSTRLLPDTYLDVQGWGKGIAWVNGHNLGWYWPLVRATSPQQAGMSTHRLHNASTGGPPAVAVCAGPLFACRGQRGGADGAHTATQGQHVGELGRPYSVEFK